MKTSNFSKSFNDPNAVAICRMIPKGFLGRMYPNLAPSYALLKADLEHDEWAARYKLEVLAKLDPRVVAKELGMYAVLLCYEGEGKHCHRHLVADWLRAAGVPVDETPYPPKRETERKPLTDLQMGFTL